MKLYKTILISTVLFSQIICLIQSIETTSDADCPILENIDFHLMKSATHSVVIAREYIMIAANQTPASLIDVMSVKTIAKGEAIPKFAIMPLSNIK